MKRIPPKRVAVFGPSVLSTAIAAALVADKNPTLQPVRCARNDCTRDATCAIGIGIFPPRAVMDHYQTDKPLSRLLTSLRVCDPHFDDAVRDGAFHLVRREDLEPMALAIARAASTALDLDATRIVRVALDDPEFLQFQRQRRNA